MSDEYQKFIELQAEFQAANARSTRAMRRLMRESVRVWNSLGFSPGDPFKTKDGQAYVARELTVDDGEVCVRAVRGATVPIRDLEKQEI